MHFFVFFGATGDLAYEQIFPALQAMIRRCHFDMLIVGVATSAKDLDGLRGRSPRPNGRSGSVFADQVLINPLTGPFGPLGKDLSGNPTNHPSGIRICLDRSPWLINTILKQQLYQMVLLRPIESTRLIRSWPTDDIFARYAP
jgi:hypothetical protein